MSLDWTVFLVSRDKKARMVPISSLVVQPMFTLLQHQRLSFAQFARVDHPDLRDNQEYPGQKDRKDSEAKKVFLDALARLEIKDWLAKLAHLVALATRDQRGYLEIRHCLEDKERKESRDQQVALGRKETRDIQESTAPLELQDLQDPQDPSARRATKVRKAHPVDLVQLVLPALMQNIVHAHHVADTLLHLYPLFH